MSTPIATKTPEQLAEIHDLGPCASEFVKDMRKIGRTVDYDFCKEDPGEWDVNLVFEALQELTGKGLVEVKGTLTITLRDLTYHEYIQSDEWKYRADRAKKRAGHRCQVCNSTEKPLDTHHRTYERLGCEQDEDLIVLCRNCHTLFHKNGKLAK